MLYGLWREYVGERVEQFVTKFVYCKWRGETIIKLNLNSIDTHSLHFFNSPLTFLAYKTIDIPFYLFIYKKDDYFIIRT